MLTIALIARAYDRSWPCLRSLVLTVIRSCVRSLVLTIALIARAYDRSCLRSLVLTIARAYGRSLVRTIVQLHAIDDRSIVLSIPLFDTTLVFVNTFNDVYSVVVLTVCTMKCILSLNTPLKHAPNLPLAGLTHHIWSSMTSRYPIVTTRVMKSGTDGENCHEISYFHVSHNF